MRTTSLVLFLLLFIATASQTCTGTNQLQCSKCGNQYFYDGKCLPCAEAKDQYLCEQCVGFYYWQKQCLPCANILNPSLCQECRGYFFLDGKCSPCENSSPYMCSLQCPDYFLKNGKCTHCSKATDELTCKFCVAKFEFREGKCVQCPKHYTVSIFSYECLSCSGLTIGKLCQTCEEYYFSNSTCQQCKDAKQLKTCKLCPEFYFNGTSCNHCNEAGEKDCKFCINHVFVNGFCVPCRLVNQSGICTNCVKFRYSTDRQMCVPCEKRGFFLDKNNTCVHCRSTNLIQNCNLCPRFTFDKKGRTCLNCSEITDPVNCSTCLGFFYQFSQLICRPCENASLLDCLAVCKNYFYRNGSCLSCQHAPTPYDCKNCGERYYWTKSNKCLLCVGTDFFIKDDECTPCSASTTKIDCDFCLFHYFSGGKCKPCKTTQNMTECSYCRSINFFFTNQSKCQLCSLASEIECTFQTCPGFLYHEGRCTHSAQITSKAACLKYTFFSFSQNQGCKYCVKPNEVLDAKTQICTKCESFKNAANCSRCIMHFFNKQTKICTSCSSTNNETLCTLCVSHTFIENKCISCDLLTKRSDCQKCQGYIYRNGECVPCHRAQSLDECSTCNLYAFQSNLCLRCEKVLFMQTCQKDCTPQGYYPAWDQRLCLSCGSADNQISCSQCITHSWSTTDNKCLNCSISEKVCSNCRGKYWFKNQCLPCKVQNCERCSSEGTSCTQCRASYQLGSDKKRCTKLCKANYCSRCAHNSSQICQQCHPDYLFSTFTGLCTIDCQVSRCLECTSNTVCKICEQGYILRQDRNACLCSINNCDSCGPDSNSTKKIVCNRCILGYQFNATQNSCNKIPCEIPYCSLCRNLTSCETCQMGWKADLDRNCVKACNIKDCTVCESSFTCKTCISSYKLIGEKQCVPMCNIANCSKCKTLFTCETCMQGYSISADSTVCQLRCPMGLQIRNGICYKCNKAISFCQRCYLLQQKPHCNRCQPGYIAVNGVCAPCSFLSSNCNNCTYVTVNNEKADNPLKCFDCSFGFSLINSKCLKCSSNCLSCVKNGEDDCDQCIEGYTRNQQAFNEIKCVACLNNCSKCTSSDISKCLACFQGSYLLNSRCYKCPENCRKCNDNKCTQCRSGYALAKSKCEFKRIQFCLVQQITGDKSFCRTCKPQYKQIEGKCKPIECSSSSPCKSCPESQYLYSGLCANCPVQNCQQCNAAIPNQCLTCSKGFYIQGTSLCVRCNATCESCISESRCLTAAPGYFIDSGSQRAVKCPDTCETCNNSYVCFSCAKGYFLFKSKCLSQQSIKMNITVTPQSKQWQRLTTNQKFDNLLKKWDYYYAELLKLIGYENRENLVFLNSVVTGSITYSLIIDKLPSEDIIKVSQRIDEAVKRENSALKVVTFKKEFRQTQLRSTSLISNSSNTPFIVITIFSALLFCVIGYLCLRKFIAKKVASNEQEKVSSNNEQNVSKKELEISSKEQKTSGDGCEKQASKYDYGKSSDITQQQKNQQVYDLQ